MHTHGLTTALTLYREGTIDLETAAVMAGRSTQALQLAHRRQGGHRAIAGRVAPVGTPAD